MNNKIEKYRFIIMQIIMLMAMGFIYNSYESKILIMFFGLCYGIYIGIYYSGYYLYLGFKKDNHNILISYFDFIKEDFELKIKRFGKN